MEGELPLVTIFTLVYDTKPKYVIEAIDSIYAQTYMNIEHIIVNDNPNDYVNWPLIKHYIISKNLPSYIVEHDKNYGICKSLNHVLELSNGKYLIGCSDDILTRDRVEVDVNILEKTDDKTALVFGMSQIIDENSLRKFEIYPYIKRIPNDKNYFHLLIKKNTISVLAVTLKKSILVDVGGFNEELIYEDYELWLRLSFKGYKFEAYPVINSYYRVHSSSISREINFEYEETKILFLFLDDRNVRKEIESRLFRYRFTDINAFKELIEGYKKYRKLDLKLIILHFPHIIIKLFLYIHKIKSMFK